MPSVAQSVLETAGVGGWDLDIATGRLSWAPGTSRLLESETAPPPSLGAMLAFYPPDARPTIEQAVRAAIEAGRPYDVETPFVTARGRRIWVRSRGRAIRKQDRLVRLSGALQDVSAQRECAERQSRLCVVAEQSSNAIILTDREGRTEWLNDAFSRLTGFSIGELRGRKPGALLQGAETDPETVRHMGDCLRRGCGFDVEIVNYTKAGRARWMAIGCTPLRDSTGAITGFIAAETDISARREAEATARREAAERERADALLRDVMETLPVAVIAYDHQERLVMWNRAAIELMPVSAGFAQPGVTLADIVRRSAAHGQYPDAGPPSPELEAWIARQLAVYRAGGAARTMRLPNGRTMQALERRSKSGNLVCVRTDTTELARAEALLRDVIDALPSAVVAYDSEERLILTNPAYARMFPVSARFAVPGRTLEQIIRLSTEHGQIADIPAAPAEREAWIARHLALHRSTGGENLTMRLADGRVVQVMARRSESGNLVSVRSDITELVRAEALLRDVLDAVPNGVTAYDSEERLVLTNRVYAEMFPISARFAVPGQFLAEVVRQAAEHGQYADTPSTPAGRQAWMADQLARNRAADGAPRVLRLQHGRVVQIQDRRSESGNLVTVRTDITDLTRAEALLRDVLDALPSGVTVYDGDERFVLSNNAYMEMFPISTRFTIPGRPLGQTLRLAVEHGQFADAGATPAEREAWIAHNLATHRADQNLRTMWLASGRVLQALDRRSASGNLVGVRTDITEVIRAEALLRDVLDALPCGVTAYDRDERFMMCNRAYEEMFPISAQLAVPGMRREEVLTLIAEHGQHVDSGATPAERAAWVAEHLRAHRNPGTPRTLQLSGGRVMRTLDRRSETGTLVTVHTDTTDLMRAEAHLRVLAERDSLTLLANRASFLAGLEEALAAAAGDRRQGGALMLIDIDYFKQINDALGHDVGDALLIEVAVRLRTQSRGHDLAARLGGDEFGVLMSGVADLHSVSARLDAMHAALSVPVDLAGRTLPLGISLGVTVFPADGTDSARLLKNADLALYDAKRNGRGRWSAFRPEQAEALAHHVRLADALRAALGEHRLTVAFQPKRLLRGGHDGFEALARWHDGTRWVPPSEFIEVAENTGLIIPLGRAVMEAAFARLRHLRDRGLQPGRLAVNVTSPQLLEANFMAETLAGLRAHGLQPTDLEIELTETVLLGRAADRIEARLREFSELGITLALDDFGTGYASLANLSRLPIDKLKIDQSFVAGIGQGGPGAVIARTVISLAHSLGMEVVAEGIETPEQLDFLAAAGCDSGQGYLFSRPLLTTPEAAEYLRTQDWPAHPALRAAPARP